MKPTIIVFIFVALAMAQGPGKAPAKPGHPIVGFAQTKDATPIVDTDVFDEAKYLEQVGSDTSTVNAKRAAHEAALTREFMDGFNGTKECDDVILSGKGENKPDFSLQIIVDSHDTPGQKPVWHYILRDLHSDALLPVGNDDTGKQAAQGVCVAVWKNTDPGHFKKG